MQNKAFIDVLCYTWHTTHEINLHIVFGCCWMIWSCLSEIKTTSMVCVCMISGMINTCVCLFFVFFGCVFFFFFSILFVFIYVACECLRSFVLCCASLRCSYFNNRKNWGKEHWIKWKRMEFEWTAWKVLLLLPYKSNSTGKNRLWFN